MLYFRLFFSFMFALFSASASGAGYIVGMTKASRTDFRHTGVQDISIVASWIFAIMLVIGRVFKNTEKNDKLFRCEARVIEDNDKLLTIDNKNDIITSSYERCMSKMDYPRKIFNLSNRIMAYIGEIIMGAGSGYDIAKKVSLFFKLNSLAATLMGGGIGLLISTSQLITFTAIMTDRDTDNISQVGELDRAMREYYGDEKCSLALARIRYHGLMILISQISILAGMMGDITILQEILKIIITVDENNPDDINQKISTCIALIFAGAIALLKEKPFYSMLAEWLKYGFIEEGANSNCLSLPECNASEIKRGVEVAGSVGKAFQSGLSTLFQVQQMTNLAGLPITAACIAATGSFAMTRAQLFQPPNRNQIVSQGCCGRPKKKPTTRIEHDEPALIFTDMNEVEMQPHGELVTDHEREEAGFDLPSTQSEHRSYGEHRMM